MTQHILPHWEKMSPDGDTPEEWRRIRYDTDLPRTKEGDFDLIPAKIERWVGPEIRRMMFFFKQKIWQAVGTNTLRVPQEATGGRDVEVRQDETRQAVRGLVFSAKGDATLTAAIVQQRFPGYRVEEFVPGKAFFVHGVPPAAIIERELQNAVRAANPEFPFNVMEEMSAGDAQKHRELLEKDLNIHAIWRKLCILTGNTRPQPKITIRNSEGIIQDDGVQAVDRNHTETIAINRSEIFNEEFSVGHFGTMSLPFLRYSLYNSLIERQDQRHTLGHEMGHILTDGIPRELSEGGAELMPTFLALNAPDFAELKNVAFAVGESQVLFGNPDDNGTFTRKGGKELAGHHAYQGWAQARALYKALGGKIDNLRLLTELSMNKIGGTRRSLKTWLRDMELKVPGFIKAVETSGILKLQQPGKKIYWCPRADGWGAMTAYEMNQEVTEAEPLPHVYRLVGGRENYVHRAVMNYAWIVPEAIRDKLVIAKMEGTIRNPLNFADCPLRVEIQSPLDPNVWKRVGPDLTFKKEDFALSPKRMESLELRGMLTGEIATESRRSP